jgi:hypothetical protein
MPFDGSEYEVRNRALDQIDRVIALLATEDKWCKRMLESADGRRCILGAMRAADAMIALNAPILQAIEQVTGRRHHCVESFNDRETTTHPLVLRVLRQARENIRAGAINSRHRRLFSWGISSPGSDRPDVAAVLSSRAADDRNPPRRPYVFHRIMIFPTSPRPHRRGFSFKHCSTLAASRIGIGGSPLQRW